MKKLLIVATVLISSIYVKAQEVQFGAGINLGLPIGDFGDTHSFGVGLEVQGEYPFSPMFSGVGSIGYTNFFGKDVDIPGVGTFEIDNAGLIPILVGIRVYPDPQFFIGGKIGYGILTGGDDTEGAFNYLPQIGYNGNAVQAAFGYSGLSKDGTTLGHLALSVIFKFGANKR